MRESHLKLWAKSADKSSGKSNVGESLFLHSLNVAFNTQRICERLPFPENRRNELSKKLMEAGVFHDLGKAATGFQKMLRTKEIWGHRHETLSTALAFILNPNLDETSLFAILTHHKDIPDEGINGKRFLPTGELPPHFFYTTETIQWETMLSELKENWELLRDLIADLQEELALNWKEIGTSNDLMNLGIQEAWLEREKVNKKSQYKQIPKEKRWEASLMRGLLITSDHLASAVDPKTGEPPQIPEIPVLLNLEKEIKEDEIPENADLYPFQQKMFNTQGNAILKAPTGSGKTLAALLWACKNQTENGRLFYVLPYTASINAMTTRFRKIFGDDYVGILHHRNADFLFRSMEEDELSVELKNKQARHLQSLAREMYHPIRVTTPHQILRFALRGRGWETGLAEFVNSCIIFDEIHAFDPLIAGLTLATAKLLTKESFNARVLFTSATIPKFLENLIKENLEINDTSIIEPNAEKKGDREVCNKKRHKIKVRNGNLLENLPKIVDEIKNSKQSTLVFCNHVKTSQQIYEELKNNYEFSDVTLLHSRFNGRDRTNIETKITRKKSEEEIAELKKRIEGNSLLIPILVATQAVEVSLDIDYERGYTEPAPADALGQRLGRVNRKGKRSAAPIVVFKEPTNGYLYDETLTNKTVALLGEIVDELSEQELTRIVDQVYENGYPESARENFDRGIKNSDLANFADDIIAGTHTDWTEQIIDKSDGQIEVLPSKFLEEYEDLKNEKRFIEAKQLIVSIRLGQYHKANKMEAIHYDKSIRGFITTLFYDEKLGLDSDKLDSNII